VETGRGKWGMGNMGAGCDPVNSVQTRGGGSQDLERGKKKKVVFFGGGEKTKHQSASLGVKKQKSLHKRKAERKK